MFNSFDVWTSFCFQEVDLLNFSLSSARIFFRTDDDADQEEEIETGTGLVTEANPGKTTP